MKTIAEKRAERIAKLVDRTRVMTGTITREHAARVLRHVCDLPHTHKEPRCYCEEGCLTEQEIQSIVEKAWSHA